MDGKSVTEKKEKKELSVELSHFKLSKREGLEQA